MVYIGMKIRIVGGGMMLSGGTESMRKFDTLSSCRRMEHKSCIRELTLKKSILITPL